MALINCVECQHPMSGNAKICPNCSAPRKVVLKNDSNKRTISTQRKMTTKPKENSNYNFIIGLLIGVIAMYLAIPYLSKNTETSDGKYFAKVNKINGLYVYINSQPANQENYTTLQTLHGNDLTDVWNSLGIGKNKFGKVLVNIFDAGRNNLVFSQVLENLTNKVRENNPDASGIIITDKLNTCQVIKFR